MMHPAAESCSSGDTSSHPSALSPEDCRRLDRWRLVVPDIVALRLLGAGVLACRRLFRRSVQVTADAQVCLRGPEVVGLRSARCALRAMRESRPRRRQKTSRSSDGRSSSRLFARAA